MNQPKRAIATLLLLVILAPFSYVLLLSLGEQVIQWKMQKKLGREKLVTITQKEEEVKWMDRHEIMVNGYMFDISTMKLENGTYTFTGLFDKEETELVKKHREHQDQKENAGAALVVSLLATPALSFSQAEPTPFNYSVSDPYPFFNHTFGNAPYLDLITPPPQSWLI